MSLLQDKIREFNIPTVLGHPPVTNPVEFVSFVRNLIGAEGFVIAWTSGHRAKVKSEWYLQLHRVKDAISREKNVVEILTSGKVDDVKAFMLAEDLVRVEAFEHEFWLGVSATVAMLEALYKEGRAKYELKRDFAVEFVKKQDPKLSHFLFAMYDGKEAFDLVVNEIASNCGSQTKVDTVRWLFGGVNWNYSPEE